MKTRSEVVAQFWKDRGVRSPQAPGFDSGLNVHVEFTGWTVVRVGRCDKCGGHKVAAKSGSDGPLHYFTVGEVGCKGGRFCNFNELQ